MSDPATAQDRLSPLDAEHRALGAVMTSFAGYQMPLRYSSDIEEHRAVRSAAGLFDLSHMGEVQVTGAQAPAAVDHAFVSRLSAVAVGRAKYTMLCAPDGGVLDDVVVYRRGEDDFLVIANASNTAVVVAELTARSAGFDAQVTDLSPATALLAVQGPVAEQVVTALTGPQDAAAIHALRYFAALDAQVAGVPAFVARTGYTGEDGFELMVPAEQAVHLWRALLEAGEQHGLRPCGLSSRDSLRLEAGMPLYGQELRRDLTPFDAGLGRLVALDRDDFVGRAALAERAAAEPVRRLVGLQGLGRRAARPGYPVRTTDGAQVGEVTSGAPSPTLGHPIALAYVSSPDGELVVDVRGRPEPVRVVPLPFYRR